MNSIRLASSFVTLTFLFWVAASNPAHSNGFEAACNDMVDGIARDRPASFAASDFRQQALLNIFERCLKLGPSVFGNAAAVAYKSARNLEINEFRRLSTARNSEPSLLLHEHFRLRDSESDEIDAIALYEMTKASIELAEQLSSILSDNELVVMLGVLLELDKEKIANHLSISVSAVYKAHGRAQEKLGVFLGKTQYRPMPWDAIASNEKELTWGQVILKSALIGVVGLAIILLLAGAGLLSGFIRSFFNSKEDFASNVRETTKVRVRVHEQRYR